VIVVAVVRAFQHRAFPAVPLRLSKIAWRQCQTETYGILIVSSFFFALNIIFVFSFENKFSFSATA
jgi:hypothetical protein